MTRNCTARSAAYRVSGADYAELYYSEDKMMKGMIAQLTGNGPSQIETATVPYSERLIGIYSTKPGNIIGEADGQGLPVPIALSGRVPILLTTENGLPKAGDMITVSASKPGFGMIARKSGFIVGQMMVDAIDNGDGTAEGYVYVRHGFWQAPVTLDFSSVFEQNYMTTLNDDYEDGFNSVGVAPIQYNYLDQDAVDEILRGFRVQQGEIDILTDKVQKLEQSYAIDSTTLATAFNIENGALSFISDATFSKNVYVEGNLVLSNNTAGVAAIAAGATSVDIEFLTSLAYEPTITLTPRSFVQGAWRLTNVTKNGFSVELEQQQNGNSEFNWQVTLTQ